ncbi:MAG: aminopeptidase [Proteobacteria bacterium]|nr:aminopeptidase [Pseudomonadota bacterium]
MYELEIIRIAEKLAREVMGVKAKDEALVITDVAKITVGRAFTLACRALGAETVMALMPLTGEHGNEPPATIAAAMKVADVVFAPTTHAITHTRARLEASKAGARVVILRGVDEDMMIKGAMTVDFQELKARTEKIAQVLSDSDEITVTSPAGTDVAFKISNRKAFSLDGYFHEETGFAALPPGEAPTCPLEGTTNGTIVFDYSMDSLGRLSTPLALNVQDGRVVSVNGGTEEVHAIERLFERDQTTRNIAEFAIGTNPNARLIGNLAEDKKLLGTVHFAIGDNESLGGQVQSSVHLDGLMLKPTVIADKKMLVENGKILVDP